MPRFCGGPSRPPAPGPPASSSAPTAGRRSASRRPLPALPGPGAGPCPAALPPTRQPRTAHPGRGRLSRSRGISHGHPPPPSPPRATHQNPQPPDWPRVVRCPQSCPHGRRGPW
ncbi:hypothetical protein G4228_000981 [Cervus hanglu yarkandensis]|nr:hypothetical protein G4228_000981 [Cervus hanglu yarkandensis]